MYAPFVLLMSVALTAQTTDAANGSDYELFSEEVRDAKWVDDEIYCGLYCVYGALRAIGKEVDIGVLLKPAYLNSFEGSNLAELKNAAAHQGAHAIAMSGMTIGSLGRCQMPVILHVRSNRSTRSFNHWILFLGVEGSKLRVMDPPGSLELVSAAELLARWDCTALMVSNRPMDPAGLIWRGRLPVLAVLAAITFVLLAQSFRATGWWSTAVPAAAFRQRLRATAVQAIAVTLIALFLGTAVHSLGNEGFIANRDAVASVTKRYQSTFLPKLQYSEVKALVGRNDAVLIDARFPPDYDAGHIPGAINLPVSADLSDYQLLRALVPSKARVVVYCQSVGCGFDEEIGSHLSFAGYSDVVLYPGGWADWKEHEHDGD